MLLPPTVSGPLTTASKGVWVSGALAGTTIQLRSNSNPLGAPKAAAGLSTFVEVAPDGFVAGALITATQANGAGTSAPSPPLVVAAMPTQQTGLPAVVFLSGLHPWVDWVMLGGLIPGCTVEIRHGGKVAATVVASSSVESIPLRCEDTPNAGDTLEAWQSLQLGQGNVLVGPKTTSLPMAPRDRHAPAAPSVAPPMECDMAVLVSALEDGASLVVNHGPTRLEGYPFVGSPVWASLLTPAMPGDTLTAEQQFRLRDIVSPASAPLVSVTTVAKLPTPQVHGPLCPDATMVRISNLRPGALVTVNARKVPSTGGGTGTLIGQFRAWATDCTVSMPPAWVLHPALEAITGSVSVQVYQENCSKGSDIGSCPVGPLTGAIGTPALEPPVACALWVTARALTPGALVEVWSEEADWPQLAPPVPVYSTSQVLYLNRPLRPNEDIHLVQTGCSANRTSGTVTVGPFIGVGTPTIQTVRIPHGGVWLSGLMVGARVHVFVNGVLRTSADVTAPNLFVPLSGLAREQQVTARQAMCNAIGNLTGAVTVTLGRMKLDIAPKSITRTVPTTIQVKAVDPDSGQYVAGTIVIGQTVVGSTNKDFAHTFGLGAPPASYAQADNYLSESITWPLVDAPAVVPRLLLTVSNQSGGAYSMDSVHWDVYRQTGASVQVVASGDGVSCIIPFDATLVGAQLHLIATVVTTNQATGDDEVAEFRGNNPTGVNGQPSFLRVLSAADTAIAFKLVNEPQTVWNGGYPYQLNKGVVQHVSG